MSDFSARLQNCVVMCVACEQWYVTGAHVCICEYGTLGEQASTNTPYVGQRAQRSLRYARLATSRNRAYWSREDWAETGSVRRLAHVLISVLLMTLLRPRMCSSTMVVASH
eukprot:COSAG01_NODE_6199_length_3798_cov_11.251690_3_plen_111_part_00